MFLVGLGNAQGSSLKGVVLQGYRVQGIRRKGLSEERAKTRDGPGKWTYGCGLRNSGFRDLLKWLLSRGRGGSGGLGLGWFGGLLWVS